MNDNLDAFSDNLLNTAFAVEVASMEQRRGLIWWAYKGSSDCGALPQFCTDANAVLPWLDKSGWHAAHNVVAGALPYSVRVFGAPTQWATHHAEAESFARAACIALIRAKRAATQSPAPAAP